ncbi:hypothetical protein [Dechloromonas denitrificans]|uniref:hypothetical protein n=1 Tax=Dechloromonas denitrificans TaxID=281362 RepID=UPI001CFBDD9E|nr:hypothetical protein [Dechloromonas denitrificans]UCV08557.1 hypothetical protein KI615_03225 [Dechloromonas denitrificans]
MQVEGLGLGDGGIHQRLILGLVTGVAGQEALPGQLADLFADQLLFIETVAQALLGNRRVEAQLLLHVVRAEPGAVIGEARIGFDQHMAVGGGKDVVEAVVRDRRGGDLAGAGVGPRRNGTAAAGGLVIEYGSD